MKYGMNDHEGVPGVDSLSTTLLANLDYLVHAMHVYTDATHRGLYSPITHSQSLTNAPAPECTAYRKVVPLKTCAPGERYDGHAVLDCNLHNLHDVLSRSREHHHRRKRICGMDVQSVPALISSRRGKTSKTRTRVYAEVRQAMPLKLVLVSRHRVLVIL